MLSLQAINESNYNDVIDLKVTEDQRNFVASNMYSLAEAYAIPHLVPRAIMLGDTLIGFMMHTLVDEEYPRHAALWRLMITPEYQGKGYGYQALQLLLDELKPMEDIDGLLTSFEPENIHASKLYEKLGMRENGDVDDGEIITIMTWRGKKHETMGAFFDTRHETYDDHMHRIMPTLQDFYQAVASGIELTDRSISILDLGCGTGMQLVEVFKRAPKANVLGLDVSKDMLKLATERFQDRPFNLHFKLLSLFDHPYHPEAEDYVISSEAMHHFVHEEKQSIYANIYKTLKHGGCFIEADYIAENEADEKRALNVYHSVEDSKRGKYHIDIPFTLEHQRALLEEAFDSVEILYQVGHHIVFKCTKK